MSLGQQHLYKKDLCQTIENSRRLNANANLLYWYKNLYVELFSGIQNLSDKVVVEVGSGASPLKKFYPQVITSDVLKLDDVDHVFDCHEIDCYQKLDDYSVDILVLTNVLHHLKDPINFLQNARKKLSENGQIVFVDPYFSAISYPIYKFLHHEPVDFSTTSPQLEKIEGPLSTSNQAIPYMMFFSKKDWLEPLNGYYILESLEAEYYTGFSYMLTGGISRIIPLPGFIYRPFFIVDRFLSRLFPRLLASFFIGRLYVDGEK